MISQILNSIYTVTTQFPNLGEYASLYFYSSLFQGNASLIAVTAMYIIYKRQDLNATFDRKANAAVDYLSKTTNTSWNYGNIYEFEAYAVDEEVYKNFDENTKSKLKSTMAHDAWKARFKELRGLDEERCNLWLNAKQSIFLIACILAVSILMLPFSELIHKSSLLECVLFLLLIACEFFALYNLYKFVSTNSK